jgi:hypothetical protein
VIPGEERTGSLICIDTNSRNEADPTYISYAISHCDALQPFRYLFFALFRSLIPFPQPFFWFLSSPLLHSNGCKGSCYFKRSILYRIGEGGVETRSCDVTSTVRVQIFRHIHLHSTFIARSFALLH